MGYCFCICSRPYEVSSLFKKKDTLIKTNNRPVSILVALSKIYEKAVGVQLTGYFNSIFFSLYFQLFERVIAASQPYWIWLKILKEL